MKELTNTIVDVPGIKVGQVENLDGITGCTVILCEGGAVGGVDQRGGAPGTRETDLLRPMHLVEKIHAVVLAGGSAFGLDAATGVVKYLDENGIGYNAGVAKVPLVSSAILFDLAIGSAKARPDAEMGYLAAKKATAEPPAQGSVGAGTGATAGKILGPGQCMKSGIGSASFDLGGGVIVAAMIAANPYGDIIDPQTHQIIAGLRPISKAGITIGENGTLETMRSLAGKASLGLASLSNTVIGVVATNAALTKEEINKVAQMAHNGIAQTIEPAHTMFDGDTIFALSLGSKKANVNLIGAYAVKAVAAAIVNGAKSAVSLGGIPAYHP